MNRRGFVVCVCLALQTGIWVQPCFAQLLHRDAPKEGPAGRREPPALLLHLRPGRCRGDTAHTHPTPVGHSSLLLPIAGPLSITARTPKSPPVPVFSLPNVHIKLVFFGFSFD